MRSSVVSRLAFWRASRYRWWVARTTNRLPRACWSDLITWAQDPDRKKEDPDGDYSLVAAATGADWCRRNPAPDGTCYCGRVRPPELDSVCTGRPVRPVHAAVGRCTISGSCTATDHDPWCPRREASAQP